MDRGAWWVTLHGVAKNQTRLRDFTMNKENRLKAKQPTPLAAITLMKKTEFIISQGFQTVMRQGTVTKCLFVEKGPRKPIKTILLRLGPV